MAAATQHTRKAPLTIGRREHPRGWPEGASAQIRVVRTRYAAHCTTQLQPKLQSRTRTIPEQLAAEIFIGRGVSYHQGG
jgi:hypothetical protein